MNHSAAVRHLKQSDPVMRRLIATVGACRIEDECSTNQFGTLVDAIIYQQLSYKAAQTISRRFQQLYGANGRGRLPRPEEILRTPARKLRSVGLSRQKLGYMRDLAAKAADGTLHLRRFSRMTDDEVIANATLVKGIGRWTAEMFLIFCLRRPDVLPVDDLGIQHAFKHAYGLRKLPSEGWMRRTAEPWRPWRTIASWYLWRARRKEIGAK
jgi:3-methyladenine DNA glycosylase/8-oxoguanine DNA glycosylase